MTEPARESYAARRRAVQFARQSRAAILEVAVRAEYLLGEALANNLAGSETAAAALQEHMMWRVPIELKLKLLSDVMDADGLSDTFPFVVPVLTRLFKIRNILAHSLETELPESRREIGFLTVHRGRFVEHSIPMDALDWLWQQGNQVASELWLISGVLRDYRLIETERSLVDDEQFQAEIYEGFHNYEWRILPDDWLYLPGERLY